jgi:hypothetical protein
MVQLGQRIAEESLARPGAEPRSVARGWASFSLGLLRICGGDRRGALSAIEEAEAIGQSLDAPELVSRALGTHSDMLPVQERDLQQTKAAAAEAVAIARGLTSPDMPIGLSSALMSYGNNLYWLDNLTAAEAAYAEGFELSMKAGDDGNAAVAASNLIDARIRGGSDRGVQGLLLDISRFEEQTQSSYVGRFLMKGCIQLALYRKLWRDALLLRAAESALALEFGLDPEPLADMPAKFAAAEAALGAKAAEEVKRAGAKLTYSAALAHARAWLAQQPD